MLNIFTTVPYIQVQPLCQPVQYLISIQINDHICNLLTNIFVILTFLFGMWSEIFSPDTLITCGYFFWKQFLTSRLPLLLGELCPWNGNWSLVEILSWKLEKNIEIECQSRYWGLCLVKMLNPIFCHDFETGFFGLAMAGQPFWCKTWVTILRLKISQMLLILETFLIVQLNHQQNEGLPTLRFGI